MLLAPQSFFRRHAGLLGTPLLRWLRGPENLSALTEREWDVLVRQARVTKLLARLALEAEQSNTWSSAPAAAQKAMLGAKFTFRDNQAIVHWELTRIAAGLRGVDVPVVLLKGAAYLALEHPAAQGRVAGDVDILVPFEALGRVEQRLEAAGWRHIKFSDYDQLYYRRWMHELPPMRHSRRRTVIDVHHTILPRTSRLKPDPRALLKDAVPVGESIFSTLCPEDRVLHSATHLFHDGDLRFALRDLVDLRELMVHSQSEPGFWSGLAARAAQMDLTRPLFYALRYANALLGFQVPRTVEQELENARPSGVSLTLMDRFAPSVLVPGEPDLAPFTGHGAGALLYMRSHWLRMQPLRLGAHLAQKSAQRLAIAFCRWRAEQREAKNVV